MRNGLIRFPLLLTMLWATLLSTPVFAVTVNEAIAQLVRGTVIHDVAISRQPHSTAVNLRINTSEGVRQVILPQNQVKVALAALKNPTISGVTNASFATRIIQQKPVLAHIVKPQSHPSPKVLKPHTFAANKISARPGAAAIAGMTAVSANQQASR